MKPSGDPQFFPPVHCADPDGLLAIGGKLDPRWLLDAYRHGIFPWPLSDNFLAWWSPDPRAVLELEDLHVSRRLRRTLASGKFDVTVNRNFAAVIQGCATVDDRRHATWITPDIQRAYCRLHELGHAHSIEVWQDGQLAGGLYGVAIGAMFAAESKFYRLRDASKVALVNLVQRLRDRDYELLDIQQLTSHMQRLGAREIPRQRFLTRLQAAIVRDVQFVD